MPSGRSGNWVPLAYVIAGVLCLVGLPLLLRADAAPPSFVAFAMIAVLFVVLSALLIFFLRRARDDLADRMRECMQQLVAAQEAAAQSDRVKTAFLTTISHELRTPLNSILGFTDVILEGYSGPLTDAQTRQLEIVRESASSLSSMIEDVLDVTRIEAGQVGLEFADVDMRSIVSQHLPALEVEAAQKGLSLQVSAAESLPTVRTDPRRAGQIVANLLANALKFTDRGSIMVDMTARAGRLEISVADTGIGIGPEALASLFQPFNQVALPGGRLHAGAGLGLAISRKLAHALGGDLAVESTAGGGSRFTLSLPLDRTTRPDADPSGGVTRDGTTQP
jgi:signal transduction histidine kinase